MPPTPRALIAATCLLAACHDPPSSGKASDAAASGAPPLVLIVGFDNRTADSMFDGTLDLALDSALTRSPTIYPLSGPSLRSFAALHDDGNKTLDDAALKVIADKTRRPVTAVRGSVMVDGTGFAIEMVAKDGATGRVTLTRRVDAENTGAVVPAMSQLASELRTSLGDTPTRRDLELVGVSPSLEADHDYVRAESLIATGKLAEAMPLMDHAVVSDVSFAEAQAALGVLQSSAGSAKEGRRHLTAALEHMERLSDRERLLLNGYAYYAQDELVLAARAYEELFSRWPADLRYLTNLAALYFRAGKLTRAVDIARQAARDNPLRAVAWVTLAEAETTAGALDEAIDHATKATSLFPHPPPHLLAMLAAAEIIRGRRDDALATLTTLDGVDASNGASSRADVALLEGRLDDATAVLRAGIAADEAAQANEAALAKWAALAEVRVREGDLEGAKSAAVHASAADDLATLFRAGRVLLMTGASEASGVQKRLGDRNGIHALIFAKLLEGRSRGREKPADAIAPLEAAKKLGDYWLVHFELGQAYLAAKAWADADRELTECVTRRSETAAPFLDETVGLHYLAEAMLLLARAKDEQHDPKAPDAYRAFLAWTPAGLTQKDPWGAEARKRASTHK